eukprot:TRINITY_DN9184_c0_g1_i1.p1 TRINITY_DN9184_c0_g1~~TRINITY_DN9184_c0_g1_i1.p1  ORF type:complete len:626 (+),score=116.91 TRINITY_DN9184_c0_g1_i1:60-1937(+)
MAGIKTKVVVAGGGPVGRVVSSILGQAGVDTVLVDKRRPGRHPKAHALTCRTMEIFRQIGADGAVAAQNPPVETWGRFAYVNRLLGSVIGVQEHLASAAYQSLASSSLSRPAHVSQPLVEDALEEITARLEREGKLRILSDYTCKDISVHEGGVNATATGDDDLALSADHFVVCDGANSMLRHQLGVQMRYGPGSLQAFMSIHFHSKRLGQALLQPSRTPPAMLYFVLNPSVICCLVAHNLDRGEFILQAPYYPRYQSPEDFTPDHCAALIRSAVEKPEVLSDLEVGGAHPWLMAAQVADRFSVDNRVFIAGDAAHRFPPAGGLGLNTGVAEAHNLAWKLAAVHRGHADPALLATYEAERRPAAMHLLDTAVECFHRGMKVPEALGMTQEAVSSFESALKCVPAAVMGDAAKQAVFGAGMFAGRHLSYGASLRQTAIQKVLSDWEGIPLFFSHEDLGIAYQPSPDGAAAACAVLPHLKHSPPTPPVLDGTRHYFPTVAPGVRMPAVPLLQTVSTNPSKQSKGKKAKKAGSTDTAEDAALPSHYTMDGTWCLVAFQPTALQYAAGAEGALPLVRVVYADTSAADVRARGVTAALVRPDGYIAWVTEDITVTQECVDGALRALLHQA